MARERLHDATEAFELAERQEREIEAEYEAWRLLLDQMKEADAAQASNLGQALVPAIAGRFQELTQRRYQTVQLTAQLATEGIVVSGALRSSGSDFGRHPRAIVHFVPVVARGIFEDGDCPGRPARAERRQPDGLVSRVACREGPQFPDRRVHVPTQRLPPSECAGAPGERSSCRHGWRVHTSGRSRAGAPPTLTVVGARTRANLVEDRGSGKWPSRRVMLSGSLFICNWLGASEPIRAVSSVTYIWIITSSNGRFSTRHMTTRLSIGSSMNTASRHSGLSRVADALNSSHQFLSRGSARQRRPRQNSSLTRARDSPPKSNSTIRRQLSSMNFASTWINGGTSRIPTTGKSRPIPSVSSNIGGITSSAMFDPSSVRSKLLKPPSG